MVFNNYWELFFCYINEKIQLFLVSVLVSLGKVSLVCYQSILVSPPLQGAPMCAPGEDIQLCQGAWGSRQVVKRCFPVFLNIVLCCSIFHNWRDFP